MNTLGFDIGGANIKAADRDGRTWSVPFAMWRHHEQLTERLTELCGSSDPQLVGLTMTAELADCFDTKADGVRRVIDSVRQAFPDAVIRVWLTSGEFAEPDDAIDLPQLVASANWMALATWAGRAVPEGPAILIDTGSTTTDIIPLVDGFPVPHGLTDCGRLESGELVYTGARRTPLCAVLPAVRINNAIIPVAAELFATTEDVHVLTGHIEEQPQHEATADGRPLTRDFCVSRIARMVCCDRSQIDDDTVHDIARQFAEAQVRQIASALSRVRKRLANQLRELDRPEATPPPRLVVSGSGSFLAAAAADQVRLTERLTLHDLNDSAVSEAACAFAIARLVHERCRDDLLEVVSL